MKKLKYSFLVSITIASFACAIFSCFSAFSLDGNIEIRLIQYISATGALNETSLAYIQQIVPRYTISFTIMFVLMLAIFLFSVIVLALSLKREQPIQEWLSAHKQKQAKRAEEHKTSRIAKLEKELEELKDK